MVAERGRPIYRTHGAKRLKPNDGFKPKRVAVFMFLHDIYVVSDGYLLVPSVFSKAV
jgi:hypothetical protein